MTLVREAKIAPTVVTRARVHDNDELADAHFRQSLREQQQRVIIAGLDEPENRKAFWQGVKWASVSVICFYGTMYALYALAHSAWYGARF